MERPRQRPLAILWPHDAGRGHLIVEFQLNVPALKNTELDGKLRIQTQFVLTRGLGRDSLLKDTISF
jgi:hypothetical protein